MFRQEKKCQARILLSLHFPLNLDRQFNLLFMCDGFEAGTLHWLIRKDGVPGLIVVGPALGSQSFRAHAR